MAKRDILGRRQSLMSEARWGVRYKDEKSGSVGDGKPKASWHWKKRRRGQECR